MLIHQRPDPGDPSFESSYDRIKEILEGARNKVYRTANSEMVIAYWNLGRTIVVEEQKGINRADYGKLLIETISRSMGIPKT